MSALLSILVEKTVSVLFVSFDILYSTLISSAYKESVAISMVLKYHTNSLFLSPDKNIDLLFMSDCISMV